MTFLEVLGALVATVLICYAYVQFRRLVRDEMQIQDNEPVRCAACNWVGWSDDIDVGGRLGARCPSCASRQLRAR